MGVSAAAIAVANPALVLAGDDLPPRLARVTEAPELVPWLWWGEGGVSSLSGGDTYIGGFASPGFAPNAKKKWAAEGALGFDYRFDAAWHLSGQFRYGQNKASRTHSPNGTFLVPTIVPSSSAVAQMTAVNVAGSGSAVRTETHWLADFMVGRDMNIGLGNAQAELGIRVASIAGTTTGSAIWNVPITVAAPGTAQNVSYSQHNTFVGVGPRAALDGSIPLGGPWSFDYNVGVAVLFGDRKANQTLPFFTGPNVNPCVAGCPSTFTNNSNGTVFNLDAQPGISYAIMRNAKLTASYRFDGYWNAMRVVDVNGVASNTNRFYQGAFLRLGFEY